MKLNLKSQQILIAILILAAIVRLSFLFVFGNSVFFFEKTGRIHGSTAYDVYAQNLLLTGVYGQEAGVADAEIAPAYSYVVAAVYMLFGRGGLQIGLLHIFFDLITIASIFGIILQLFKEEELCGQSLGVWIGALAAIFTALYPYLIFQNLAVNDTALFTAQLHLFIWLLIRLRKEKSHPKSLLWAVFAGLILGFTTLTRALLPPFAILAALWFLFHLNFRQAFLRLFPVAIVSLLVLLPWIARNYQIYGTFVPVALNFGNNFWQGNNSMTIPLFEAGYEVQWSTPPEEARNLDEQAKQIYFMQTGLSYLRENPEVIPRLLWVKFLVYWDINVTPRNNPIANERFALDENGNLLILRIIVLLRQFKVALALDENNNLFILQNVNASLQDIDTIEAYEGNLFNKVARPVHMLYYGGLLLLAIWGVILSAKNWREVSLLWFLQISMMGMYLIFHPSTRYRVPTDPLLFAFSAFTILYFVRWWIERKSQDM